MTQAQCTGDCCSVFVLSEPYVKLVVQPEQMEDGDFILDMLRPLTQVEVEQRVERLGLPPQYVGSEEERFTCRHWDEETRLCRVYEHRPMMCRRYPHKKPCAYGCGLEQTT